MEQEQQFTKKERIEQKRQEKMKEFEKELKKDLYKKIIIGVVILAVVGGIIGLIIAGKSAPDEVVDKTPDPAKGPENAPVVIKEYNDFACPGCAGAYPVVKDLLEEYGDTVRFQYNDFPLPIKGHEYAPDAAIAAQCVFDQGKFFEYHDKLFDDQRTWAPSKSKDAAQELFRQYAQELQVDMAAFDTCVSGDSAADRVNEDILEGRSLNVNQTPTFFVNGKRITDAPFSTSLKTAIEEALNADQ